MSWAGAGRSRCDHQGARGGAAAPWFVYRTIIVGGGQVAAKLARILAEQPRYGLQVVGFLDTRGIDKPAREETPWLGEPAAIESAIHRANAEVIIVKRTSTPPMTS